ncbi:MAG TPA: hypothetical protein VGR21_12530 [Cryptosporangiaceae bacterium]|nr:hypothetical protein [Cryptosporangiaceae bacterium]
MPPGSGRPAEPRHFGLNVVSGVVALFTGNPASGMVNIVVSGAVVLLLVVPDDAHGHSLTRAEREATGVA